MNKINKFFLMSSVALSGMVGFSSCSSDDTEDGSKGNVVENGVVKTEFALNIPQASGNTRMSENMTQQGTETDNWKFRGINDMRLFAFADAPSADATVLGEQIVLGSSEKAFESDKNRRIYRDVIVPVGTKNFVFYGTAAGATTNAESGKINEPTWGNVESLADVKFTLQPINADVDFKTATEATTILTQLNAVAKTEYDGKKWSEASNTSEDQYEKHAAILYKKFIGLTAGSYASVKSTLAELITAAGKPTTDASLLGAIAKSAENAIAALDANADVKKFPAGKYNLPDGIAQLTWSNTEGFGYVDADGVKFEYKYVKDGNTLVNSDNKVNYKKISYPASLNYTINTPVKANDKAITGLADWPAYKKWGSDDKDTWSSDWKNEVSMNSRSIGLKKAVQYAVATLQTTVKAAQSLKDNAEAYGQVADNTLATTNGEVSNFLLTGLLIGGQPSAVDWEYNPVAGDAFDYTIYDNQLNNAEAVDLDGDGTKESGVYNIKTSASEPNYTLVLDNNNKTTQADVVYVTLELVNKSGSDFYGYDGVVPNNGKFYLVGKLDVNAVDESKGNSVKKPEGVTHIFQQDFITKANFTIGSLKNAYNNIPDLRSSSISLGLAVNLEWQNGMEFNYTIE